VQKLTDQMVEGGKTYHESDPEIEVRNSVSLILNGEELRRVTDQLSKEHNCYKGQVIQ
jgi:hypothetical protein